MGPQPPALPCLCAYAGAMILLLTGTATADATTGHRPQPWEKQGLVLAPGCAGAKSTDRVSAPCVVPLDDGRLRMYFWTTGEGGNYIFAAEASPESPKDWTLLSEEPLLGPDPDSPIRAQGPSYPWVVSRRDGPWLMYYCAWGNWAAPGEIANRTCLALSDDEGITWQVVKEPLLPLGPPGSHDAALTGSVCVLRTKPDEYRMWYTAGSHYADIEGVHRLIAHIGYATSTDGIEWARRPEPLMSPRLHRVTPYEAVVSKPSVLVSDGVYHMWLSVLTMSGGGYRLGYARSGDGIAWTRHYDEILPLGATGYDTRNHAYPCVITVGDELWMFHVGNDFGATGIALATMPVEELTE